MPGIGIILNRNAGKRRPFSSNIGEKLGFILGDPQSLRETWAISEIEGVARAFLERNIDILGIGGGDGSNHYTLDTFIRVYGGRPLPKVVFMRGGSHNSCALSVGQKGTPDQILQRLVRQYHSGERLNIMKRKMMRVDDGVRVHHSFVFGSGFLCKFFEAVRNEGKDRPWKVAALLLRWAGSAVVGGPTIRAFFDLEPARLTFGEELLPWERINATTAAAMEAGLPHLTPFPRANADPDKFQAGALRVTPRGFLPVVISMIRARDIQGHPDIFNVLTDRMLYEAEAPITYTCDGEIFVGGKRLLITTGPKIDVVVV